MNEDIRWKQRLENYKKALSHLTEAVEYAGEQELSDLEQQGLVQAFEFTFELSWNLMKDYLTAMGITEIIGSRGAVRHAFNQGIIPDGQVWMSMIEDRNRSSHTYDDVIKNELVQKIVEQYHSELAAFAQKMERMQ
jgi:nucleotidyltransferase substrate binding protein (TIGR01987 family)